MLSKYKDRTDKQLLKLSNNNNNERQISEQSLVLIDNNEKIIFKPNELKIKYNYKFYYIIFGVMVLVVSSFLTMLFTVNGGIQNGFHDYALDLSDGTIQNNSVQNIMDEYDTYNVNGNIQDFKTNYKRSLSTALNWNLLLNNGSDQYSLLTSADFNIDWSDVDWDHTGYYNITISSNDKFLKGNTTQTINIIQRDIVDMNRLDMIALKTTPYVTTDPTAEQQELEYQALQILKNASTDPDSITADDITVVFENDNPFSPDDGLDLTNDQIGNTMTIYNVSKNPGITGLDQTIIIRPQAYDLSSEDMFYESPHSAYTSMGSELSGHMMSDEPHNFNTMYLDIHDVSEQYDTPTDYIWNQEAISLMSMTNQMLANYAYSWTQNDTGSWTADVSHNDFVNAINGDDIPSIPKYNSQYYPEPTGNFGTFTNSAFNTNVKVLDNQLPRNEGVVTDEITENLISGTTDSEVSRITEVRRIIKDGSFLDNSTDLATLQREVDLQREVRFKKPSNGEKLPDVNWDTYPGDDLPPELNAVFEEATEEATEGTTAAVAAELEGAEGTLAAGGDLAPEAVAEAVEEILVETADSVAEAVTSSFGAEMGAAVGVFFAEYGAMLSGVGAFIGIATFIISAVLHFTTDDTMMLPSKISTLAMVDINDKFQEIADTPVEYGGIPDLPMPTDTNGNVTSWTSIIDSTMTDSTVIEDWNWCPPNGTWEDRYMSWYGYSITAKPDNGVVTGSANMHIKFYSTSGSD